MGVLNIFFGSIESIVLMGGYIYIYMGMHAGHGGDNSGVGTATAEKMGGLH